MLKIDQFIRRLQIVTLTCERNVFKQVFVFTLDINSIQLAMVQ